MTEPVEWEIVLRDGCNSFGEDKWVTRTVWAQDAEQAVKHASEVWDVDDIYEITRSKS
jgi:hypothetical protein